MYNFSFFFFLYIKRYDILTRSTTFCPPKAKGGQKIVLLSLSKFGQNRGLLGQKPETEITRTPRPSEYSLSFDLRRTKSRTSI